MDASSRVAAGAVGIGAAALALIILAALAMGAAPDRPSADDRSLTIVLQSPTDGSDSASLPTATVRFSGRDVPVTPSKDGLTWPVPDDYLFLSSLQVLPTSFDPGTGVTVEGNAESADLFIAPMDSETSTRVGRRDERWFLSEGPGRYRLTVVGHWSEGSAAFSFGLVIE